MDKIEKPQKKVNSLQLLIWFRLSRIYHQSIRDSNQYLKNWGLTAAQFDVLVKVGMAKKLTQKELGEKLLVTKGNITQLLSKMETLDLIQREQVWKTKYLSLTPKGESVFEEVVPLQEQFQADQFSNLTKEEQKQLLKLLRKLQQT